MRIVHIMDPGIKGKMGVTEVVMNLSYQQTLMGNEVQIILLHPSKYYASQSSVSVVASNSAFKERIEDFRPDLVIFHSLYKKAYINWYKILCRIGIPYFIEMHGASSQSNQKKSYLQKKVANFLYFNHFVKAAAAVVFLNKAECEASVFKDYTKNVIIPNGVNIPQDWKEKSISSFQMLNITFLGRIDIHHKGLDLLIHAIDLIQKELINKAAFHFYGYTYNEDFPKMIQPYGSLITFHGPVYGEEKETALNGSHIFIHTSRYEGMPIAVIEALAHGLPCIVTPQTNMGAVIEENNAGWITSLNAKDISQTILRAIDDYHKNAATLQRNARQAVKDYSWENVAKKSIEAYQHVVTERQQHTKMLLHL